MANRTDGRASGGRWRTACSRSRVPQPPVRAWPHRVTDSEQRLAERVQSLLRGALPPESCRRAALTGRRGPQPGEGCGPLGRVGGNLPVPRTVGGIPAVVAYIERSVRGPPPPGAHEALLRFPRRQPERFTDGPDRELPVASAASGCILRVAWLKRLRIRTASACPSRSAATFGGTPLATIGVALVPRSP